MKIKLGNGFKRIYFAILILIYKYLLELSYAIYLGNNISWLYGVIYKNYYSYIIFIIVIEIVGNYINKNVRSERNSFRSIVMYLLYFWAFIPGLSYSIFEPTDTKYMLLYLVYWDNIFVFYAIATKIKYNTNELAVVRSDINKLFVLAMIIFSIYLGWRFKSFKVTISMQNIYDLRQRTKDAGLNQLAGIFRGWVSYIVLPFLFLWSINKKKYFYALFFFYLMLVMFSVAGEKTILLLILLGGILSFLSKKLDRVIPILLIGIVLFSIFENYIIGSKILSFLFTYRTNYLPVQIGYYFYDFLKDKPKLWFMEGVVGSRINTYFFDRSGIYTPTLAYKIGYEYFGGNIVDANTGLFGSAYAEMGISGIFIGPLILVMCLVCVDKIYKKYDIQYSIIIAIYFVAYVINGPITGLILGILIPSFLLVGNYKL